MQIQAITDDVKEEIGNTLEVVITKFESWYQGLIELLPNIVIALLLLIIIWLLARLTRKLFYKVIVRAAADPSVQDILSQIIYYVVWSVGFFIILEILHLDKAVTSLLAGVGVLGIALGFAFQNIAANFVSGIILTFRKPIRAGDIIEIQGVYGKYIRSNFRITVIETFQGQEVYLPNKDVLQTKIINYTILGHRRIDLFMGVSYGDELEKVKKVTLDAVAAVEGVRVDKGIIFDYNEFDDFSINFYVRYWIDFPGHISIFDIRSNVINAIKKAYDQNGITIPFPIRTLDFGIKGGQPLSEMQLTMNNRPNN